MQSGKKNLRLFFHRLRGYRPLCVIFFAFSFLLSGCTIDTALTELAVNRANQLSVVFTQPYANISNQSSFAISGSCSSDLLTGSVLLTPTVPIDCRTGSYSILLDLSGFSDGNIDLIFEMQNGLQKSVTVVKDTVAPTLTLNVLSNVNLANQSASAVSGTCSESTSVVLTAGSVTKQLSCSAGSYSGTFDFSSLADGTVTLVASQTDVAGNQSTASRSTVKDTVVPTVAGTTTTGIPSGASNLNYIPLLISGADITHYKYRVVSDATQCAINIGMSSAISTSTTTNVDVSGVSDGSATLCVWASDSAGNWVNMTDATANTWTVDHSVPSIALQSISPSGLVSNSTGVRSLVFYGTGVVSYRATTSLGSSCAATDPSPLTITPIANSFSVNASTHGVYYICVWGKSAGGTWSPSATEYALNIDLNSPTSSLASSDPNPINVDRSVNVSFNENVTGLSASDFSVTNGTVISVSGSGATYAVQVSATADGSVSLQLPAARVIDVAGNSNLASNTLTWTSDKSGPSLTISSSASAITNANPIPISITISETAVGFTQSDLTVNGGTISNFTGSGTSFGFDLVPSGPGTITVGVAASTFTDQAGNQNSSSSFSIVYDSTQPSLLLSSAVASSFNSTQTFSVTALFSEAVTGFTSSDVGLTNATISGFSGSGTTYTFQVNPTTDGVVQVTVANSVCIDVGGNQNIGASITRTYDNTKAVATFSTSDSSPTASNPISYTVTWNEAVTGFTSSDLGITGGVISNFSGSGASYSFDVTPSAVGTVSISLAADQVLDAANNGNQSASTSIIYDTDIPTVTLTSASSTSVNSSFTVQANFSHSMNSFILSDIVVGNGTASAFSGSGASYSFTVTPTSNGAVTVSVPQGRAISNSNSYLNSASNVLSRTYDNVAPTLSLTSASSTLNNHTLISVSAHFSESVTGFTSADISPTNATISNFTGSGADYSFDVTPSAQGTVVASVASGAAQDAAGNNSTSQSISWSVDYTAPTLTLSSAVGAYTGSSFSVTATFSESVIGFAVGDLNLTNATVSGFSGSGSSYSWTMIPTSDGPVSVSVSSSVAQDASTNNNSASNTISTSYDSAQPSLSSVTITNTGTQPSCNTVRVTVSGAADSGSGLSSSAYSFDGGSTYQASSQKDFSGMTVNLSAGQVKVRDAVGNVYTYSSSLSGTASGCSCNLPWSGTISHGATATAYLSATPAGTCSSETRTCNNGTLSGSYTNQTCTNGCTGTPWGSVATGYSGTAYQSSTPAGACVSETRTCTSGTLSGSYAYSSCTPSYRVLSINMSSLGSGYTSTPTVSCSGGGGSGASATANLGNAVGGTIIGGSVSSLSFGAGGSGYSSAPSVTIYGGGGSGATGTATLSGTPSGGSVSSITLGSGGTGYTSTPTITISGGGGTGATAVANMTAGTGSMTGINIVSYGSNYMYPSFSISGGGGSGASITNWTHQAITGRHLYGGGISNGGSGYTSPPTVISDGTCGTFTAHTIISGGVVTDLIIDSETSTGWTSASQSWCVILVGGGGSGAVGYVNVNNLYSIYPTTFTGGSGYTSAPTITVTETFPNHDHGSGASFTPIMTYTQTISSITITSPGSGYTSAPTITISGGGGSGATANANMSFVYPVASVSLGSGGSGYTSQAAVSFSGGGGSGASATTNMSYSYSPTTYSVTSITMNSYGSGYTSAPSCSISGGGGSGASGTAVIGP